MQEVSYWEGAGTGGMDFSDVKVPMKAIVPDSVRERLFEKACAVK